MNKEFALSVKNKYSWEMANVLKWISVVQKIVRFVDLILDLDQKCVLNVLSDMESITGINLEFVRLGIKISNIAKLLTFSRVNVWYVEKVIT